MVHVNYSLFRHSHLEELYTIHVHVFNLTEFKYIIPLFITYRKLVVFWFNVTQTSKGFMI